MNSPFQKGPTQKIGDIAGAFSTKINMMTNAVVGLPIFCDDSNNKRIVVSDKPCSESSHGIKSSQNYLSVSRLTDTLRVELAHAGIRTAVKHDTCFF
jgi:hypothetical protein